MRDRAIGIDGVVSTLGGISKKGTISVTKEDLVGALVNRFHQTETEAEQAIAQAMEASVITITNEMVIFNRERDD